MDGLSLTSIKDRAWQIQPCSATTKEGLEVCYLGLNLSEGYLINVSQVIDNFRDRYGSLITVKGLCMVGISFLEVVRFCSMVH